MPHQIQPSVLCEHNAGHGKPIISKERSCSIVEAHFEFGEISLMKRMLQMHATDVTTVSIIQISLTALRLYREFAANLQWKVLCNFSFVKTAIPSCVNRYYKLCGAYCFSSLHKSIIELFRSIQHFRTDRAWRAWRCKILYIQILSDVWNLIFTDRQIDFCKIYAKLYTICFIILSVFQYLGKRGNLRTSTPPSVSHGQRELII